jgi:hypothetical protein
MLQTYGEVIGMRHDDRLCAAFAPDRLRSALRCGRRRVHGLSCLAAAASETSFDLTERIALGNL